MIFALSTWVLLQVGDDVVAEPAVEVFEEHRFVVGAVFLDAEAVGIGVEGENFGEGDFQRLFGTMEVEVLVGQAYAAGPYALHIGGLDGSPFEASGAVIHTSAHSDTESSCPSDCLPANFLHLQCDIAK